MSYKARIALPPAMNPNQPTQKDIAYAAGVSQATVSLALSNHPRLSEDVRRRIQKIATELGYVPDPYLSGLSAYRKRQRNMKYQATLAWLSNDTADGERWSDVNTFAEYYNGAQARASQLGYVLEEHRLQTSGMTPQRMRNVLKTKNVPGVLFAPQQNPNTEVNFPLELFSAVSFGYTMRKPKLHVVTTNHFQSMELLLQNLLELGYRRPGMAIGQEKDLRMNKIFSSSFYRGQHDFASNDPVPLLLKDKLRREDFLEWYYRHRPDVVIGLWEQAYPWFTQEGIRIPQDVGMAVLSVNDRDSIFSFSGIWENPWLVGQRAVELVVDLVHRAERGIPLVASTLLVDGTWLPGQTLCRQTPAAKTKKRGAAR